MAVAASSGMMVWKPASFLLRHRETYRQFWAGPMINVARGLLGGTCHDAIRLAVPAGPRSEANPRSLLNWPMQASGADMLRLACIGIAEAGIRICAPVHDAILIEAPIEDIDEAVEVARREMIEASAMVLGGPACRVDEKVITYPDRYMDVKIAGWPCGTGRWA